MIKDNLFVMEDLNIGTELAKQLDKIIGEEKNDLDISFDQDKLLKKYLVSAKM